jgi:hypothetical protein
VELRPYQKDAVEWMISRERGLAFFADSPRGEATPLPHGWVRLPPQDAGVGRGEDGPWFYNPFSVAIAREPPLPWDHARIRGGILADESEWSCVVSRDEGALTD